jgi:hypothetical protein
VLISRTAPRTRRANIRTSLWDDYTVVNTPRRGHSMKWAIDSSHARI